ncbi:MAG TPA: hypothetical protein VMU45_08245 [Candidatus Eisenbacteria bacterium]|nr:hypothetical protein [Candidatus Eisenbacteria bacterium]
MKRTLFGALMTLIVAFTVATPMVHAQTIMTANVPFAFSVGDHQLPAGAYAVREMDRATLIASKDGQDKVLGIYQYAGPSKADETKLVFDKVGDHYFLAQIWTSASGQGLQVPQSKLEKELRASNTEATGGAETVIVALR